MKTLTTSGELAEFCARAARHAYVTIDTEFLRERTYYSRLCLIQMALPPAGGEAGEGEAVLVDVLAPKGGMDLGPLYDLFRNRDVVKVFHAARQDLEIFFHEGGVFPEPFFDTQVAAMVCGFGEQVGYETLVRKIVRKPVDKTSRFTDWSRRPLSDKQKAYALADVTHLRAIYEDLDRRIREAGRSAWVDEELAVLTDPETYTIRPEDAWQRVKTRTTSGKFLAVVRELARFREEYAQSRNLPRNRVFKDDALLELASTRPQSMAELGKSRLLLREARKGAIAEGILAAIRAGDACPPEDWPRIAKAPARKPGNEGLTDLLRVLLKARAEEAGVAQRLIASAAELAEIAAGSTDVAAFRGWRHEVFGRDALRLMRGEVALAASGSTVRLVELPADTASPDESGDGDGSPADAAPARRKRPRRRRGRGKTAAAAAGVTGTVP